MAMDELSHAKPTPFEIVKFNSSGTSLSKPHDQFPLSCHQNQYTILSHHLEMLTKHIHVMKTFIQSPGMKETKDPLHYPAL